MWDHALIITQETVQDCKVHRHYFIHTQNQNLLLYAVAKNITASISNINHKIHLEICEQGSILLQDEQSFTDHS